MSRERAAWIWGAALAFAVARGGAQIADIRQGTNIAVALAPDATSIVIDLLGGLWQLPATGGGAIALVPAGAGVHQPRFHPDGRSIVAQRWLDGQWDLWLFDLETRTWRALTTTPYDEREPEFSADGRSVLHAADRTGRFALWAIALGDGSATQLTADAGDASFPTVSDRGELVYVEHSNGASRLRLYNGSASGTEIYRSELWLTAPSWRPGGRVLVFNAIDGVRSSNLEMLLLAEEPVHKSLTRDEDVFPGRVAWSSPGELIYTADGQIWRRGIAALARTPVHLFAGVGLTSADTPLVAAALDAPGPHRATGILGASTARDGDRTAFAALGDLWLLERGEIAQLTDDPHVDAFPSVAPNGESVVFVSDRGGSMDLWQLDLGGGAMQQLTRDAPRPFEPVHDPTGRFVAYLETSGLGPWSETSLRLLELAQPQHVVTLATGLYDARQLGWDATSESPELLVAASPVRPGGQRLQLRIAAAAAASGAMRPPARAAPVPDVAGVAPQWHAERPAQPYVVQIGRLFDGVRGDYARHMDVHVDGQRITAVVRRGSLPLPAAVIDARDATMYPGLIDTHVHQSVVSGAGLGRVWLANGVTTVREITDDVADALERAESWASGRRPGPRLVISPSADPRVDAGSPNGAPVVLAAYTNLSPGLAHLVHGDRERPDIPRLAAAAPLAEIAHGRDAAPPVLFPLSARNMSYQDAVAVTLAARTVLSTGLAALAGTGADRAVIAPLQDTVARVVRSGAGVAVASDAPAVPYGTGLHDELALLSQARIPNDQVLRLATAGGAIALGLDRQLGTVEAGKLADFVVVSGDPLERIGDAAAIVAVVKAGVWRTRAELLGSLDR